jgi:hypothetical protein
VPRFLTAEGLAKLYQRWGQIGWPLIIASRSGVEEVSRMNGYNFPTVSNSM